MKSWILLVVVLVVAGQLACTSTTVLRTQPMGAKVYIDGQFVGKTPYVLTDRKFFYEKSRLEFKKPHYNDLSLVLTKDDRWELGHALAFLAVFPLFWIKGYEPEYQFELTKKSVK